LERIRDTVEAAIASEDRERKIPANEVAAVVERRCLEAGLILQLRGTGPGRKNVLRLGPPMTTTEVEIDRALAILDEALAAGGHPARVGLKSARPTPTC